MISILDNPIYHSLTSGHDIFSEGNDQVRFYDRDIASFAGLKNNSVEDFNLLNRLSEAQSTFVVFAPEEKVIPEPWKIAGTINMFQMVFTRADFSESTENNFKELSVNDVNQMLELTELTKPGPFLARTIELSNYIGCFDDSQLVAMAGYRFNPSPFIEISAVCTHPNHLGKGYAYQLMSELIRRILSKSAIPFLHVRNDNIAAIKLYQKLGFEIRIPMMAYILKKP